MCVFVKLPNIQYTNTNTCLIGTIPTGFGATMTALSYLSLHKNHLFGTVPSALGNISYLVTFSANLNNLTGTLPDSLWDLTDLAEIRLDVNSLTGFKF